MLDLFFNFLLIGLFTIGGGYAMIAQIKEYVILKNYMTEEIFLNYVAIAESTPGPIAVNIATLVGYNQYGILGAIVATSALVIPSFVIISLIYHIYKSYVKNITTQYFLTGIRIAVAAIIVTMAGMMVVNEIYDSTISIVSIVVGLLILPLFFIKKKIHPVILILLGGVLSILINYLFKIQ